MSHQARIVWLTSITVQLSSKKVTILTQKSKFPSSKIRVIKICRLTSVKYSK